MAARLMLIDRQWDRTCRQCAEWEFDDRADSDRVGLVMVDAEGDPLKRMEGDKTPCFRCPKIPKPTFAKAQREGRKIVQAMAVDPDERHRDIVEAFLESDAVRQFPSDPWTRIHARLIRPVADYAALAESSRRVANELATIIYPLFVRR